LEHWPSWLRRRAEPKRVWVHPGVLARLRGDGRLHAGGGDAAVSAALGVAASTRRRFYLREQDFAAVMGEYRGREDPDGEVELMLVPSGASELFPPDAAPVPLAAALLDLLESPDSREHHAAAGLLNAGLSRLTARA
jgi:hypothetical protein